VASPSGATRDTFRKRGLLRQCDAEPGIWEGERQAGGTLGTQFSLPVSRGRAGGRCIVMIGKRATVDHADSSCTGVVAVVRFSSVRRLRSSRRSFRVAGRSVPDLLPLSQSRPTRWSVQGFSTHYLITSHVSRRRDQPRAAAPTTRPLQSVSAVFWKEVLETDAHVFDCSDTRPVSR
jgi:hypothetical protein